MLVINTSINYQVAKETKVKKMNLFYLEDEEETPKKKNLHKKKSKSKIEENKEQNEKLFSFDNEIIIGVTKKQEPKKQESKKQVASNSKKNNNKNKKDKKKVKSKKEQKKQFENKTISQKSSSNNKKQAKKSVVKENKKIENKKIQNKKRNIAGIIKYSSLVILFITLILCAMFSPLFNIKTIQVEGNELITQNEIISLSKIQTGENTFKLNKSKIKNQIKENAYIDEVIIKRKLPSNIIITVEERKPAYLLEYAGAYIYLDKQGYMLEINNTKLEIPILQGASTQTTEFVVGNRLCVEDLEKLLNLIKIMELAKVNELSSLITRIDIENKQNIKLIFETKEKIAYLGDNTNLIDKIPIIKKILEENEGIPGEIFVNMDLNKENPIFRERV